MQNGARRKLGYVFPAEHLSAPQHGVATREVSIETLDRFCEHQGINHIGFLKIDTEGGDFDVLCGAAGMLATQQIDLVEVEAGMNSGNKRHVPFEKLKAILEDSGYLLFGIYEQIHEWPTKEPHLRRTNLVFNSSMLAKESIAPYPQ